MDNRWPVALLCGLGVLVLGCSGDDDSTAEDESTLGAGDEQTPATNNAEDIEAWLSAGHYKSWACEMVVHPQMQVSPHGFNLVCSNDLAAGFEGGVDEQRPLGTASVKELYDDSSTLVGVAFGVKIAAESDGGSNWYWYERFAGEVVANGLGSGGVPKSGCVRCHASAGSDAMHALTGSSDFVYLQVTP